MHKQELFPSPSKQKSLKNKGIFYPLFIPNHLFLSLDTQTGFRYYYATCSQSRLFQKLIRRLHPE